MSATMTVNSTQERFEQKQKITNSDDSKIEKRDVGGECDWRLKSNGRFESSPHDVSEQFIPKFAGLATTSQRIQKRFYVTYVIMIVIGLSLFHGVKHNGLRVLGLSMIFPGAGFLAIGGTTAVVGFLINIVILPITLIAWAGAGGVAFPIILWLLSGFISFSMADDAKQSLFEPASIVILSFVSLIYFYLTTSSAAEKTIENKIREERNEILAQAHKSWVEESSVGSAPGSRELTLEQLRWIQATIELGMQELDDWSNFTVIDQFQVSALRYQLYVIVYCLSMYHSLYVPNYNGASALAMRNAIEKSQKPKVLNFWKWESLWGNFTLVCPAGFLCVENDR